MLFTQNKKKKKKDGEYRKWITIRIGCCFLLQASNCLCLFSQNIANVSDMALCTTPSHDFIQLAFFLPFHRKFLWNFFLWHFIFILCVKCCMWKKNKRNKEIISSKNQTLNTLQSLLIANCWVMNAREGMQNKKWVGSLKKTVADACHSLSNPAENLSAIWKDRTF